MSGNKYIDRTEEPEMTQKPINQDKKPASKGGNRVAQILSGDFLAREFFIQNLGFIFFVMLLLLLLVAKGYYVKQLSDNIIKTERELDDINTDYVELKARFLEETRRDKLVEKLKERGLKEPTTPPKVIRVKE
jgi:cell division protein FtsL